MVSAASAIAGYLVYTRASEDPLARVDAIIVLGGEHDGREQYGIDLAESGLADVVVLSDPYRPDDVVMRHMCNSPRESFVVMCARPTPSTTRGEALFTQELAAEHGWETVMVISWRYHLPRARYIFGQCFSGRVITRAVPRAYDFSMVDWAFTYAYQTAGFVKAVVEGPCDTA
ncbi:YdcF family protein [Rhodococcus sp. BP-349]|nr:YdcF family protein [Rhodococcus sp. BP-363]MBY6541850.1 YdcF family protein [Rhodococcus sp. BP-369]MBY6561080.1 YdcF family protein [Rhodococcus sp. BP-370]MBY6575372.1 YdcF family protein [Rhodococcus sp. BP-364]MBY6584673.1 YdcF family protein [Rhodococcus sp. BP-358]MBY6589010.1 YdcF family protein [Rhodococcus sp. BP-362]MBY6594457.1 YdcF family protein [Rhodococcus sp. BP-359]MBY6597686.1 YdcF family protein [Rhodococcus sp. BP-353]MBY6603134.1 YdcF family protein [Rhodococcus sp.